MRTKHKTYGSIRKKKELKRSIFSIVLIVLFAITSIMMIVSSVITATVVTDNTDSVGNFMGYSFLTIATGSMSPEILPGDVVIIKNEEVYSKGDVITFASNASEFGTFTHRITAWNPSVKGFQTKGDANNTFDEGYVPYEAIIGKVVAILPQFGRALSYIQNIPSWIFIVALISISLIFIVVQVLEIIKYNKSELTDEELKDRERVKEYNLMVEFIRRLKKLLKMKIEA